MSVKPIEDVNKFLSSLLYRFVLLLVGTSIAFVEVNTFHWSIYLLCTSTYIFSTTFFRFSKHNNSLLRLIADYTFITVILYGKGLDTFINSCFIIIPIVNSVNHTSHLKNGAGIFRLYIACLISMFIISNLNVKYSWVVSIIAFGAISAITKMREFITRIDNSALTSISDYHGENLRLGNSYLLLKKFVKDWQSNRLLTMVLGNPINIVVFKKSGNRIRLISGATFVKNYVFLDEIEVATLLEKDSVLYNVEVLIDNDRVQPNICIQLHGQIDFYIFYIELSKSVEKNSLFDSYVVSIFARSLSFVVKVLDNEGQMIKDRNNLMKQLQGRVSLVDKTINVVHFINNRLTPIVNFFEMYAFYKSQETDSVNHAYLPELAALIATEQRKAKDSLTQIDTRSKSLLKRASEARLADGETVIKYKQIVRLIRESWLEHAYAHDEIKVGWSEEILEKSFTVDTNELWLMIEEVATNVSKYRRGKSRVNFSSENEWPVIIFINELDNNGNVVHNKKVKSIVEQFNNNDLNEIMRRNSRGLYVIKSFCNKYNIATRIEISTNSFTLALAFPIS